MGNGQDIFAVDDRKPVKFGPWCCPKATVNWGRGWNAKGTSVGWWWNVSRK
jgi:hypothetical protein